MGFNLGSAVLCCKNFPSDKILADSEVTPDGFKRFKKKMVDKFKFVFGSGCVNREVG